MQVKELNIKADYDQLYLTLRIEKQTDDTSSTLKELIRDHQQAVTKIWDQANINYNLSVSDDTSVVVLTSRLNGVKEAQLFFNPINNYKYRNSTQQVLKINVYKISTEPDSVLVQIKFDDRILRIGQVKLENVSTISEFKPTSNQKYLDVDQVGVNSYVFKYSIGDGKNVFGLPHVVEMKYPLMQRPQSKLEIPSTDTIGVGSVVNNNNSESSTYIFTQSFWYFIFAIIGAVAAAIAIAESYNKRRNRRNP